eukprot:TRINITY_DN266_c0_g1_i14.p1 TRINITY_DN266_c0_g1~~TRINITY_DN266_c0_g1_i14.p1  ORF type:complete len:606 (+),score=253.32 TRINITY_DN266_c0_g1_i14:1573-3390(+)
MKETGAQAVHPGYGFLSENPKFVHALDDNGLTFIGPNSHAIDAMGDKIMSKTIATNAKVNTVPGFLGEIHNEEEVLKISNEIQYPVMIKASAGGGGKGMRIAWNDEEAIEGFRMSKAEAASSFGDDRIFIEKFIDNPRHIEIQVLCDKYGNGVYLNERECSIQRRNQKVIEEAPSVCLDEATRKAMGEQALQLAQAVNYDSAGTVEFLVDSQLNFYFLEMNTRLQVEHPITEMITGVDLVEQMIRVAEGKQLEISQSDIGIHGWAIESRVYAEDPLRDYLPSIGRLHRYQIPTGEGVRVDGGIIEGSEISMYYDPMISKLVTHGKDRTEALERMRKALDTYIIRGVDNNINLLRALVDHPRFIAGNLTTKFLPEEYPDGFPGANLLPKDDINLVATAFTMDLKTRIRNASIQPQFDSYNINLEQEMLVTHDDVIYSVSPKLGTGVEDLELTITNQEDGTTTVIKMAADWEVESELFNATVASPLGTEDITLQHVGTNADKYSIQYMGSDYEIAVRTPKLQQHMKYMPPPFVIDTDKNLVSPMPGMVQSINVKVGDKVAPNQELVVVEAMKMQNILRSEKEAVIKSIKFAVGESVATDDIIIEYED